MTHSLLVTTIKKTEYEKEYVYRILEICEILLPKITAGGIRTFGNCEACIIWNPIHIVIYLYFDRKFLRNLLPVTAIMKEGVPV